MSESGVVEWLSTLIAEDADDNATGMLVLWVGSGIEGERFALVEGKWSDGHGELGISARRLALVSIDHGRPVWARAVIDHPFPQMTAEKRMAPVQRTWTLEAIDACPGSLATVGWQRPDDVVAEHERALQALGESEPLRKREEDRRRKEAEPESDPFAPPPS